MKKIIIFVSVLLLTFGCSLNIEESPKAKVQEFLNKYNNNDAEIMDEMDTYVDSYDFTDEEKEKYKEVLQKQFKDLKYDINEENIDKNNATVDVKITVYDLYNVQTKANEYLKNHPEKFNGDDEKFDETKFNDYKIEQMAKTNKTIDYNITFHLTKEDNEWQVDQLNDSDLEKIHGIYNYEDE